MSLIEPTELIGTTFLMDHIEGGQRARTSEVIKDDQAGLQSYPVHLKRSLSLMILWHLLKEILIKLFYGSSIVSS